METLPLFIGRLDRYFLVLDQRHQKFRQGCLLHGYLSLLCLNYSADQGCDIRRYVKFTGVMYAFTHVIKHIVSFQEQLTESGFT